MADIGIVLDRDLDRITRRLERLAATELTSLLDLMGSEVESQTRRRIESEKTGPGGEAWEEWSEAYATTRHGGHSLLEGEGSLLDSMTYELDPDAVVVGTNLIYGAIHQLGGEPVGINIPARPYLGLSPENEDHVLALVEAWVDDQILGAA